jgi:Ca-activated chloride channel family protein
MRFAQPMYFILILPAAALLYFYLRGSIGKEASLLFSDLKLMREAGAKPLTLDRLFRGVLRFLIFLFLVFALARPQTGSGESKTTQHAVDIMISLDISGSMATLDFHPDNRLIAAKIEAKKFIAGRPNDRIGLVIFGGQSFTQCPLTIDHQAVLALIDKIQLGMVADGTAIGLGLANAVNRLKDSEAKSKVVILLTDGVNNAGEIDPITAGTLAKQFKFRVHTIAVGKEGESYLPVPDPRFGGTRLVRVQTEIDEATLQKISSMTGGSFFRAQDEHALRDIFSSIDKLEKTEITVETHTHWDEHYFWFLWPALFLFLFELVWLNLLRMKLP